jgi:negative regulator of sigma E activity
MGLSDDQRAMLRLLAQRGEEGYDDVAALMGLSVEEVRAKVAEALAVLAEEGALAPQGTTPGPPAAPTPEPTGPPEPVAAFEPEAPAKVEPPPAPKPSPVPAAAKRKTSASPKLSFPSGNGPRAAIAAAAIVLVAVVVVLIVSGGSSSDSSSTSASNTTSSQGEAEPEATPTSNNAEVTKAVLKPVAGAGGSGVAIFGRVKNSLALQVVAKDLPPTTSSTEYTVWLAQSPQRMLPLASTQVKADGRIGAQFKVPTEVLAYLANGTFDQLVITRTSNSALEASLAEATKEERAPKYTGTEVLRGTVIGPIVGAAKRLKEEKEAEKGE